MEKNGEALYGLYSTPQAAQRAVDALRDAGVDERKLAVLSSEPFDEYPFGQPDAETPMPWLAVLGGVLGGVSGYLLAAWTQQAHPIPTGGMPIVTLWADGIITYEMTMLGAILATAVTLLASTRLPHWKPSLYDPEVSEGKILIGVVNPSESAAGGRAEIERRLLDAGAPQVKQYPS